MKIDYEGTGTAAELADKVLDAQVAAELAATDDERKAVAQAFEGLGNLLSAAPADGQATARLSGELRGTELVHVYMDVTIVPSAAIREAAAGAERTAPVADDYEPASTIGDSDEGDWKTAPPIADE